MSETKLNDSGISGENDFDIFDQEGQLDPTTRDVIRNATNVPYTSSETTKNVRLWDQTVEVVGIAENIESSRRVGVNNLLLFKFVINNADGERIQVTAWNDEVNRTEAVVQNRMIIHLEGAYAKQPKPQFPNKGTVHYELNIEPHTTINILGKVSQDVSITGNESMTSVAQSFQLADVGKSMIYSQVDGYIKMNFVNVRQHGGRAQMYGCGSITDGLYMLRIRIVNFDDEHDFEKGDHVRIKGFMRSSANPVFFTVNSLLDVSKIDDKQMDFVNLLRGTQEIAVKREAGPQVNAIECCKAKKSKTY